MVFEGIPYDETIKKPTFLRMHQGGLKYQTYIWIHVVGTLKTMPRSNSPKVKILFTKKWVQVHQQNGMVHPILEIHIQKKYEAFHSHGATPMDWENPIYKSMDWF